jgi:isopentenyl phosphate kinase
LGGSLITNKDVPLSVNKSALRKVAIAIRRSGLPTKEKALMLIHGGGSFGHYYAQKFQLSTVATKVSPKGIAQTEVAMFRLHAIAAECLLEHGVATYTILPSELLDTDLSRLSKHGVTRIKQSLSNDLVPFTFGHVGMHSGKAFIISGDVICKALVLSMKVERVIFAMDVDGIYSDSKMQGEIIPRLSASRMVHTKNRLYDVTGGLRSKLQLGFFLRKLGTRVFYVNGAKAERLTSLLRGGTEVLATEVVN